MRGEGRVVELRIARFARMVTFLFTKLEPESTRRREVWRLIIGAALLVTLVLISGVACGGGGGKGEKFGDGWDKRPVFGDSGTGATLSYTGALRDELKKCGITDIDAFVQELIDVEPGTTTEHEEPDSSGTFHAVARFVAGWEGGGAQFTDPDSSGTFRTVRVIAAPGVAPGIREVTCVGERALSKGAAKEAYVAIPYFLWISATLARLQAVDLVDLPEEVADAADFLGGEYGVPDVPEDVREAHSQLAERLRVLTDEIDRVRLAQISPRNSPRFTRRAAAIKDKLDGIMEGATADISDSAYAWVLRAR